MDKSTTTGDKASNSKKGNGSNTKKGKWKGKGVNTANKVSPKQSNNPPGQSTTNGECSQTLFSRIVVT